MCLHTFFLPTSDFQQMVAYILYSTFFHAILHWRFSNQHNLKWQRRLSHHHPYRLTWTEFCKEKLVYICLHVGLQDAHQFHFSTYYQYIGSSVHSLFSRRNARIRKCQQIERDKLSKCELAIRYWKAKENFFQFLMIPWRFYDDVQSLRVQEILLIQHHQPQLNYPFISRLIFAAGRLPRRSKMPPVNAMPEHKKLRNRLRRRLSIPKGQWLFNHISHKHQEAWQLIYDLSSATRTQLQAWRTLRSPLINATQLLYPVRLANTAEAHIKFKALHHLYRELKRRNCARPKNRRSLCIPFLAHSEFQHNLRHWLRSIIIKYKQHATEFHIPSTRVCCKSSVTIAQTLQNFKMYMKQWALAPPTTCRCQEFLQSHTHCRQTNGHIASPMSDMNYSTSYRHHILQYSSNSQCFLSFQTYLSNTTVLVQTWLAHHNLEVVDLHHWKKFVTDQWPLHLRSARSSVTWKEVRKIALEFKDFVIHCIDHRPYHTWIFCPVLYHQLLMKTFGDPATYTPLRTPPVALPDLSLHCIPKHLLQRYPWGFRTKFFRVASAYILPKLKKDFTTARSIVAYHNTIAVPILSTISWLLIDISKQVFHQAFGDRTVYQIWRKIHAALDASFNFEIRNDDLVGFFTSLPQDRIISDVQFLLDQYCDQNNLDLETATMSVPSRSHAFHQSSIQGHTKFTDQVMRSIKLSDVLDCVKMSFDLGIFHVCGLSFRQTHGTAIGNQISPVLSGISVSKTEHQWALNHHQLLHHVLVVRYVDNRLILAPDHVVDDPVLHRQFLELCDSDFYKHPVELEPVKNNEEFLGFMISPSSRQVRFIIPTEKWQYRHPFSAGSVQTKSAALNTRTALAWTHAYPFDQKKQDLQSLRHQHSIHCA